MDDEDITIWNCPRCDGKMVRRKNRETDEHFLGCSNYPRCKHTQPVEPEEDEWPDAASRWE